MKIKSLFLYASVAVLAACELEPAPATQVMVVLNSDMVVGEELKRVRIDLLDANGRHDPADSREFALRTDGADGSHDLPLSFSLVPPKKNGADRFRVLAVGFASNEPDAQPVVEQKVIASFASEQSLLLEIFLGKVCKNQLCNADTTCYVQDEGSFRAGQCGTIPEPELTAIDPREALDEADWPEPWTAIVQTGDGDGDAVVQGDDAGTDGGSPPGNGGTQACGVDHQISEGLCDLADSYEPNEAVTSPYLLDLAGTCSVFESTLRVNDQDNFAFDATMNEPIRVSLNYTALNDTTDLTLVVNGSGTSSDHERSEPSETEQLPFYASKGKRYVVRVLGEGMQCQPYVTSIDTAFCTDSYEDNDVIDEAFPLTFEANGSKSLSASKYEDDSDYYQVMLAKHDPFRITGSYTVDKNSTADLHVRFFNATNSGAIDGATRSGLKEEWSLWELPAAASSYYRVMVGGDSGAGECIPYDLKIDSQACTDEYEDNDELEQAKPGPVGVTYNLTTFELDDDYFALPSLSGGGKCTLEYTPVKPAAQPIGISVYHTTGGSFSSETSSESADGKRTVVQTWEEHDNVNAVRISFIVTDVCQPYTLRCE